MFVGMVFKSLSPRENLDTMMRFKDLLVAFSLVLVLAGCGNTDREAILTGKWQADFDAMMEDAGPRPQSNEEPMKRAQQMRLMRAKVESLTLTMNEDKTFAIRTGTQPKADWEGTWSFDKETGVATFTTKSETQEDGKPKTKTATFTGQLADGNRRFTINSSEEAHMIKMAFKKVG